MEFKTVEDYLNSLDEDLKAKLEELRKMILTLDNRIIEKMSYNMPTYKLKTHLISFCAYKKHIGIYPGSDAITFYNDKLKNYRISKGTIQIDIKEPIPLELIKDIVKYNIE